MGNRDLLLRNTIWGRKNKQKDANVTMQFSEFKVRDSSILMLITGVYITSLIVANITAGKLFDFFGIAISVGAFAYMLCLGSSDIIVDIYGARQGYKLVGIGIAMNLLVLLLYQIALSLPVISGQEALQVQFVAVFASSTSVIVGSLCSYPITESIEVLLWSKLKRATKKKHMWLRNAVVPIVSQLIDATIFFNLAFFIVPILLYSTPLIPATAWWQVMIGAWLYGLWKGVFLGTFDYPVMVLIIPWVRKHREGDIPDLDAQVKAEESKSRW